MTPLQKNWWRIALELKLRKSSGDAFQDFFSSLMEKLHGADFVRVRAFGSLGDKGCDGYLMASGDVFQCYGALNSDQGKVAYLIGKMEDDYGKARNSLSSIIKKWAMVHNLIDGLPVDALLKLEELRGVDKTKDLYFIGLEGFEERLFKLQDEHIEHLLGLAANEQDFRDLQIAELSDLISGVASLVDAAPGAVVSIGPVPVDKIKLNNLPGHWHRLIEGGWQNAHLVGNYLLSHSDPLLGENIAQVFRVKYRYLKAQNISPGNIMSALYEMVVGQGAVSPQRQVVAQALLAYLFESCDIFEDRQVREVT